MKDDVSRLIQDSTKLLEASLDSLQTTYFPDVPLLCGVRVLLFSPSAPLIGYRRINYFFIDRTLFLVVTRADSTVV